jgi:hypothetical protein
MHEYMANTLPAELIDCIIDYLHDDPKTLSACSLVCRSWLLTARHRRWSRTRLERARIGGFMSLLADNPNLSSVVTHLHLYHLDGPWRRQLGRMAIPDQLAVLLNALPNLRGLELKGWLIVDKIVQVATSNRTFRALRELALIECDCETLDTMANLITMPFDSDLPSLESITLWGAQALQLGHDDWSPPVTLKPAARNLSLSRIFAFDLQNTQKLFKWMLQPVTILHLDIPDERDADLAGFMLRVVDDVLRELDLTLDTSARQRMSQHQLSGDLLINSCSYFHSLKFVSQRP